jgi:hypothetical protein
MRGEKQQVMSRNYPTVLELGIQQPVFKHYSYLITWDKAPRIRIQDPKGWDMLVIITQGFIYRSKNQISQPSENDTYSSPLLRRTNIYPSCTL